MANHKSALKRARQNEKRRLRNRGVRGTLRSEVKQFISFIEGDKKEEAKLLLSSLHKTIDKAATKGILTKNSASRKKSRVTLMLNKALA